MKKVYCRENSNAIEWKGEREWEVESINFDRSVVQVACMSSIGESWLVESPHEPQLDPFFSTNKRS